ncbi:MAG: hypothetical protein ACYTHJ_12405 [Planctomycetota bacterium]|jgi:hypothetical protein
MTDESGKPQDQDDSRSQVDNGDRSQERHYSNKLEREANLPQNRRWLEAIGLRVLLQASFIRPQTWMLAVVGIILTVLWGSLLDEIWSPRGGVGPDAIGQLAGAYALDQAYVEPDGSQGIFETWRNHQVKAISLLLSMTPTSGIEGFNPVQGQSPPVDHSYPRLRAVQSLVFGNWWLIRWHPVFAFLLAAGMLMIWSVAGGAICRIAGARLTRDEHLSAAEALAYVRPRLWGGFVAAPCIPLTFLLLFGGLLFMLGFAYGIPYVGDLLSILLAPIGFLLGVAAVVSMLSLVIGGSLFAPSVAIDGSDGFQAFSSSVCYTYTRSWKTLVYTLQALLYTALAWFAIRWVAFGSLLAMRMVMGFGAGPFGWWGRGEDGTGPSKIDRVWAMESVSSMHEWPDWSQLPWHECLSGALIGCVVLLVIAIIWGYLATMYFTLSTAIYILLRRDVDLTDLGEIYEDEDLPVPSSSASADERR